MNIFSVRGEDSKILLLFEKEETAKDSVKLTYSKFPTGVEFERETALPPSRIICRCPNGDKFFIQREVIYCTPQHV